MCAPFVPKISLINSHALPARQGLSNSLPSHVNQSPNVMPSADSCHEMLAGVQSTGPTTKTGLPVLQSMAFESDCPAEIVPVTTVVGIHISICANALAQSPGDICLQSFMRGYQ